MNQQVADVSIYLQIQLLSRDNDRFTGHWQNDA
jgi:hypothetical protein